MSDIKSKPPKAYAQGYTEFYKLKFKVNPSVLIPRPETELLVDEVIKQSFQILSQRLKKLSNQDSHPKVSIIDIGTGSGCIAVSIAKNIKEAAIVAEDISAEALGVAEWNAQYHKVSARIVFIQNNLYENFSKAPDIIVANLPYIPTSRLLLIDPMVTDHEPKIALDGGADGFELYRKLFMQINQSKLFPHVLIAEIDELQGDLAKDEAKKHFPNAHHIEIKKDLAKKDRVLIITFDRVGYN